ncbi:MAG: hypothetical protein ACE5EG_08085, partial [Thermoanaerobaculia bacterium]
DHDREFGAAAAKLLEHLLPAAARHPEIQHHGPHLAPPTLEELHRLLPPDPDLPVPAQSLPRRLRRRLALWVQRLLLLISGPQWHLNALLTELGLATYVRHRLQEGREDELSERIAGLEEQVALLRRRLDSGTSED